tara:strand:- start:258 stop:362 length:105 start_codon:yes stop_codon:yes gene_type:complete
MDGSAILVSVIKVFETKAPTGAFLLPEIIEIIFK